VAKHHHALSLAKHDEGFGFIIHRDSVPVYPRDEVAREVSSAACESPHVIVGEGKQRIPTAVAAACTVKPEILESYCHNFSNSARRGLKRLLCGDGTMRPGGCC
jgi:hypothetical protein